MNARTMTFVISLVILIAGIAIIVFVPRIEVAVGVGMINIVAGYWIRDAQDRATNGTAVEEEPYE